jgi:hypothetical protein
MCFFVAFHKHPFLYSIWYKISGSRDGHKSKHSIIKFRQREKDSAPMYWNRPSRAAKLKEGSRLVAEAFGSRQKLKAEVA